MDYKTKNEWEAKKSKLFFRVQTTRMAVLLTKIVNTREENVSNGCRERVTCLGTKSEVYINLKIVSSLDMLTCLTYITVEIFFSFVYTAL